MKAYQTKTFNLKALDVDTATKQVKVAIGQFGSVDLDKDMLMPDSAIKTVAERGPKGSNEIWHLVDHRASLATSALCKFSELYCDKDYIVGVSNYKDTALWRDQIWPLYEGGDINQHSIGFTVVKDQMKSDYNEIQEIKLWEGSAVLWGANPNTPTLDVFKSLTKEKQAEEITDRFKRLRKGFKSDIEKSLLLIELKQLEQIYIDTLANSTPAAEEAQKPLATDFKQLFSNLSIIE